MSDDFKVFFQFNKTISNSNLKKTLEVTKKFLNFDFNSAIIELSYLICSKKAIFFPINFLLPINKEILLKEKKDDIFLFQKLCKNELDIAFWNSKTPSYIAFTNYYGLFSDDLNSIDKLKLLFIIDKTLSTSIQCPYFHFTKLLEGIFEEEFLSDQIPEYFGQKSSFSVFLNSYLPLFSNQNLNSQDLISIIRFTAHSIFYFFSH